MSSPRAAVALALAAPAAAASPTSPVYDSKGNVIGAPFVPQEEAGPSLREREAIQLALANRKIADWVDRYERPEAHEGGQLRREEWALDREGLGARRGGPDRPRARRGLLGSSHGGLDRPAGRVEDGARLRRGIRPEDQRPPGSGFRSAPSSCLASRTGASPSRSGTSTSWRSSPSRSPSGSSTGARSFGPCRSSTRRCCISWAGSSGSPGAVRGTPFPGRLAGLAPPRRYGLPRRVQDRPQPAVVERDRCRLRRSDRGRADRIGRPDAVRPHADRRRQGVRDGRRGRLRPRADPGERPLRVGERSRGHVRAGELPRVRARIRHLRLERQVGDLNQHVAGPTGGAFHLHSLRPARARRDGPRRETLWRHPARRHARVRVGGLPLHPVRLELELERRAHARAPDLGVLAPEQGSRPRVLPGARFLDEIRLAPAPAALGLVPASVEPSKLADDHGVRRRLPPRHLRRLLGRLPRA